MHELSIALSILDVAAEEAERRGAVVEAIHVKLGLMSGVVKHSLMSAFELAREGSPLAHANLVIREVPVTLYCERCQAERPAESIQSMRCVACQTPCSRIMAGRELEVTALEIQE